MTSPFPPVVYYKGLRFDFCLESLDVPDVAHYTCTIGRSVHMRAFTRWHALELDLIAEEVHQCKPTSI
jgi:hypothetical protein